MKVQHKCTWIFTIEVKNIDVLFQTSSISLGIVQDSHARGPGSIPHAGDSVMKVMGAGLFGAVAGSEEGN